VSRGFEAIKTVVVDAPRAKVWDALTNPAKVKQYLHGTDMATDWMVGSPIIWRASGRATPMWTRAPSSRSSRNGS
jgi:uncharacterized protein YndB with AHSA1/START domain